MHQTYDQALEQRNTELEIEINELKEQLESLSDLTMNQLKKSTALSKTLKDYLAIIDTYSTRIAECENIEDARDWSIKMLQHALNVNFED